MDVVSGIFMIGIPLAIYGGLLAKKIADAQKNQIEIRQSTTTSKIVIHESNTEQLRSLADVLAKDGQSENGPKTSSAPGKSDADHG